MAAISAVFTISHVATLLGEDEDWLFDLSIDMFPEDGCLHVYGVGEDGLTAFTQDGIDNLKQIIFGAACPRQGTGAALVLPFCKTAGKSPHLAEIARLVEPGQHAVLLLDWAAWHLSAVVEVPVNITLLPLPAKCPELNVMENVWQFIRDNWLSHRVCTDHHNIVDHCFCHRIEQPWRIMSICIRDWAHRF